MRAAVCTRYGGPEVLRVEDRDAPVPRGKQVLIRVDASCVTSSDAYLRGLRLPLGYRILARAVMGWSAPRQPILGMVLAGEVAGLGPEATALRVGDRVFGFNRRLFGAHAEYACWPEDDILAARPTNLSAEEAAAVPYGGLLALHFLRRGRLRPGSRVLVYGASGAVGTSAVQLARHFGAEVTAVCGAANAELVTSLGATSVLDYTSRDFLRGSGPFDLIFDAVGKKRSSAALRDRRDVLAPGGRSVSVDDGTPRFRSADLALLGRLAETGELRPVIDSTFDLEDIVSAHRRVDGGHKRGNVIVRTNA